MDTELNASDSGPHPESSDSLIEHRQAVYNKCYSILEDVEAAQDATQETFVRAYRNIHQRRGANPRPWVLAIAKNTALEAKVSRGQQLQTTLSSNADDGLDNVPDVKSGQTLRFSEALHVVFEAVMELPPMQRDCLLLTIKDYSISDISEVLKISEGAVRQNLHHARKKMRGMVCEEDLQS